MKLLLVFVVVIFALGAGFLFITFQNQTEQKVLESTYNISKEYLLLRYRTDNILVNAKNYSDYSTWKDDMTKLLKDWENLEEKSQKLENSAVKVSEVVAINFKLVQTVHAYSAKEISNIYDKAPKFKGISTLANHLGVDAKRAQAILNKAQAEISADVFTEEGDAFETLENTAIVVKDGCKVVGFVGGVVLTGGAAGLATAGTLTQVGVVVVGADLALEVTEDGAQIAFGDRNKVTSFVKGVRTVTEPIATVITISNVPGNLGNAFGKFDSVMVGLEQFRDTAQEGKVVGVDLRNFEYEKPFQRIRQAKYPAIVSAAEMEMAEVETWLQNLNKGYEPITKEEVEEFLKSSTSETELKKKVIEENIKIKDADDNRKEVTKNTQDIPNQIYKVVNVSGSSFMMDVCHTPTCWDDLAANPQEGTDVGGIYTMGKVFGNGESFRHGFRPADLKASGRLEETAANSYKITVYFAIAPFEGPRHKTIDYGTWQSHSVEISANYGDEPVIEWSGSSLKQVK